MRSAIGEPAVEQGTRQKDKPGYDGDPVQLAESASDDIAGEMRVGQNLKRRRRENEGKEDQPTNPGDKRQQHEET